MRLTRYLFVLVAVVGCLSACRRGVDEAAEVSPIEMLPMSVVETLDVGRATILTLGKIDVPDGTIARVMAVGSYGIRRFEGRFEDGVAQVLLSAEFTQRAGHITLYGSTSGYAGETALTIIAGEPISPLTTLVGPRTIIANRRTWTDAVVIPFDRFYNPVPDGTTLTMQHSRPDETLKTYTLETTHLLAWQRIQSSTTAGRSRLGTNKGSAFGPEAMFEETPDDPVEFTISTDKTNIPADGHQLVALRTSTLRDHNGNRLLDGTLVTFLIDDNSGIQRNIPAYTLDGIAEITIQAAKIAGEMTISAFTRKMLSQPLTLNFVAKEIDIPLTFEEDADTLNLEAGPLLGNLAQFLPDGTEAIIYIRGDGVEQTERHVVVDGLVSAEIRLAGFSPGEYEFEVVVGDSQGTARYTIVEEGE